MTFSIDDAEVDDDDDGNDRRLSTMSLCMPEGAMSRATTDKTLSFDMAHIPFHHTQRKACTANTNQG